MFIKVSLYDFEKCLHSNIFILLQVKFINKETFAMNKINNVEIYNNNVMVLLLLLVVL